MRNVFDGSWRGRRPSGAGKVPDAGSPYDFSSGDEDKDEDKVDQGDLLPIHADDELLDVLASGRMPRLHAEDSAAEGGLEAASHDDQQLLELLGSWRDEVRNAPIPDLISVEQASEAIVAGYRASRPRRRLVPVAAAAAAVVLGLSGVAIAAGGAQPGDALWGVSKTLNSDRASSIEAAQQVNVALASVRQALDEGRVADAQATLASVAPELNKVTDQQTKAELATKQANLVNVVSDAQEGQPVHTDESGKPANGPGPQGGAAGQQGAPSQGPPSQGPPSQGPPSQGPPSQGQGSAGQGTTGQGSAGQSSASPSGPASQSGGGSTGPTGPGSPAGPGAGTPPSQSTPPSQADPRARVLPQQQQRQVKPPPPSTTTPPTSHSSAPSGGTSPPSADKTSSTTVKPTDDHNGHKGGGGGGSTHRGGGGNEHKGKGEGAPAPGAPAPGAFSVVPEPGGS